MQEGMLHSVVPDQIWCATQPLTFGPITIRTRMTAIRLVDGSLWVHSPVAPTPALVGALQALGPVRHVLAPNRSHHLFVAPFLAAFPGATAHAAPGLSAKRPDLAHLPTLGPEAVDRWAPDLRGVYAHGLPILNETAWFHGTSGTLVVADLLFRFGADNPSLTRAVASLLGVRERLAMSRTMKLCVKDRAAFAGFARALLELPVRRIVVAHDSIVETSARAQLEDALHWAIR